MRNFDIITGLMIHVIFLDEFFIINSFDENHPLFSYSRVVVFPSVLLVRHTQVHFSVTKYYYLGMQHNKW